VPLVKTTRMLAKKTLAGDSDRWLCGDAPAAITAVVFCFAPPFAATL